MRELRAAVKEAYTVPAGQGVLPCSDLIIVASGSLAAPVGASVTAAAAANAAAAAPGSGSAASGAAYGLPNAALGPGAVLNWSGLLLHVPDSPAPPPLSAAMVAGADTTLWRVPAEAFTKLAKGHPEYGLQLSADIQVGNRGAG